MRLLSPMLLLLAASACSDQGPPLGVRGELEVNRARWEASRPTSYSYTVERRCFCGVDARGPVVVRVSGGAVVARTYRDTGQAVPEALRDLFPPVGGLFDILEDALDGGADHVQVTWDSASGVPLDFFIDYEENVADEEQGYGVLALPSTG